MSRVAIVGCGVIAPRYAQTLAEFGSIDLVACVDGIPERAALLAAQFDARVATFDEIIADDELDAIVNLTPPQVHAGVSRAALESGRAVWSEKPLSVEFADGAELVRVAKQEGVRLGCSPDTFLGDGIQSARAAIDRGDIGQPLGANAFMLGNGPEWWHPGPAVFYERGAGPLFDMGPYYFTALVQLLGPARTVVGAAHSPRAQRPITSEPLRGQLIDVEVPTHVVTVLEMEAGPIATVVTSFDVQDTRYRNIEIYGTEATLSLPDPNGFGGPVRVKRFGEAEWLDVPRVESHLPQERGLGLADMLAATRTGREHRGSAEGALHVLELMTSTLRSAEHGRRLDLTTRCARSEPLPSAVTAAAIEAESW